MPNLHINCLLENLDQYTGGKWLICQAFTDVEGVYVCKFLNSILKISPYLIFINRYLRKLPRATTNVQKNKSYVGLFISYVGLFISYVGLIKSYVGLYNSYVGDKIS